MSVKTTVVCEICRKEVPERDTTNFQGQIWCNKCFDELKPWEGGMM